MMVRSEFEHNMLKEILEEPDALAKTYEKNEDKVKTVSCNILKKYKGNLYVTGSGTSFHAGLSFQYSLFQLTGVYPTAMFASELPTWISDRVLPTVLIAVSQSGESTDVINAVKRVSELKFHKVAVTNKPESHLTRIVDDIIFTYAGEERALAATKTYVTQVLALLMLSTNLSYLMKKISNDFYLSSINNLQNTHILVKQGIEKNIDRIKSFVEKVGSINRAFVLGSGALYPSAIEGSLKIKETCTTPSEGFALREFLHGPIQLAGEKSLTLILGHSKLDKMLYIDVMNKVKNFGGKVLLVSDRFMDAQIDGQINIEVPYDVSPIVFAPVFQTLAYFIALSKGLNPDAPEKLSKVVK